MSKDYRVGRLTAGLLFIGLGVALLLRLGFSYSVVDLFYYGWPFLLIVLGGEILFVGLKDRSADSPAVRYDVWGVVLLLLVALVTLGLYGLQETGVAAFAEEMLERHYYNVETPFYTVDQLSGVEKIKVLGNHGQVNVESTVKNEVKFFGTWQRVAATDREEAHAQIKETLEAVREGETLYIFMRQPPIRPWEERPYGRYTLYLPANLPVELEQDSGELSVTLHQLQQDWSFSILHGDINLSIEDAADMTVEAAGGGDNFSNPEAWDEVNAEESEAVYKRGAGDIRFHLHTETGAIRFIR